MYVKRERERERDIYIYVYPQKGPVLILPLIFPSPPSLLPSPEQDSKLAADSGLDDGASMRAGYEAVVQAQLGRN